MGEMQGNGGTARELRGNCRGTVGNELQGNCEGVAVELQGNCEGTAGELRGTCKETTTWGLRGNCRGALRNGEGNQTIVYGKWNNNGRRHQVM